MTVSDEDLVAFADDELDEVRRAAVAAALNDDPEAAAKVAELRATALLARKAFDAPIREPVPDRLLAAIGLIEAARDDEDGMAETGAEVVPLMPRRRPRADAPRGAVRRWALPLAASVALVVGVGAGLGVSGLPFGNDRDMAVAGLERWPSVAIVLEQTPGLTTVQAEGAGDQPVEVTPMVTFRDDLDRFCREFQAVPSEGGAAIHGIACRTGDQNWQPTVLVTLPPPAEGDIFAPASDPIDALRDVLIGNRGLNEADEQEAIESGWQ